jgi:hypothetical protein
MKNSTIKGSISHNNYSQNNTHLGHLKISLFEFKLLIFKYLIALIVFLSVVRKKSWHQPKIKNAIRKTNSICFGGE